MAKVTVMPVHSRPALIDERGDIKLKLDAIAATGLAKRLAQIDDELSPFYADKDAEKEFVERGLRYELRISARRNQTFIDVKKAYRKLGIAKFISAVTLTLKALGNYLTETEIGELTTVERNGSRSFTTTPYGVPVPAAVHLSATALSDQLLEAA